MKNNWKYLLGKSMKNKIDSWAINMPKEPDLNRKFEKSLKESGQHQGDMQTLLKKFTKSRQKWTKVYFC